jgi:hypothetical protein
MEATSKVLSVAELKASISYVVDSNLNLFIFNGLGEIIINDLKNNFHDFKKYKNIIKNNCNIIELEQLITKPTYIFYYKKLKLINYDYDLAEMLVYSNRFPLNNQCYNVLKIVEGRIIDS